MMKREKEINIKIHSHNLPVFVKQIGFRKIKIDDKIRKEVALMKCARHQKLAEFIGICPEPTSTYIVEGTLYKYLPLYVFSVMTLFN